MNLFRGTASSLFSELIKEGIPLKRSETKEFIEYIGRLFFPTSKALLSNYIVPTRNGYLNADLVYVLGSRVYCNKGQEKKDEVLPLELQDTMKGVFEKKGCKEAYYNVILNKLAPPIVIFAILLALSGCLVVFVTSSQLVVK